MKRLVAVTAALIFCGSMASEAQLLPPPMPTKGRALDHIGFEIGNLEAFCNKLEAAGVKFDQPYAKNSDVANALITDPWGTSIELTEGLAKR